MRSKYTLMVAAVLFSCSTILAGGTEPVLTDSESSSEALVVEAMTTMYVAATADDLTKFNTVASPAFYAFDGGERFAGDALMALISRLHAAGSVYVWRVTEPEVHVHGDLAWITYVNRGSIQDASGTKPVMWLESAVLGKEDGRWRIRFFHSTRVP
jgi:ketosteroid isomerase-like protein